ncbi:MAG: hypothetical protein AB7O55_35290 [Lautropia sp.]
MPNHLTAIVLAVLLAGCGAQTTRVVEVPTVVEVPGPVQWREIPQDLLKCDGRPAVLRDGITGGELRAGALGWQGYAVCLEGRLQAIRELPASMPSSGP